MKALITGGGGFLGRAVVKLLLHNGDQVRSLSRTKHPQLQALGVEQVAGDIAAAGVVENALAGCDCVFHVAAKAGIWGHFDDYYRTNVVGTQNVVTACRAHGVKRLIYTSSPSVVFSGDDLEGVDETVPYPKHYHAFYPRTKATAEQLVLAANDERLATVALRPHLIWGPGDNHLVPRIIARGQSGALRRIGAGNRLVDCVYIDNAARAHIQAAAQLAIGAGVAGKTYFITNDEPLPLWDIIDRILAAAALPPVSKSVSPRTAYLAGAVLEKIYGIFRLGGEPRMTRFLARELSTAHWFDITAAKRDFGYRPQVSIDEGMRRLRSWLQDQHES